MLVRNQMKLERSERRTAAWLRQEAEDRGLRVGRKVRVEYREKAEGNTVRKFWRSGRVIGLYSYIFACEIGEITECFRYNELLGNETERVKLCG